MKRVYCRFRRTRLDQGNYREQRHQKAPDSGGLET
jgi:hypothetical protein